jgi:hypothetical protein
VKRRLIALALLLGLVGFSLVPGFAIAQPYDPLAPVCEGNTATSPACDDNNGENPVSGSDGVIIKAVRLVAFLGGAAAVIMIIVAGLRMVLANGDSKSFASARNSILYAAIGLIVIVLAQTIIVFVINRI